MGKYEYRLKINQQGKILFSSAPMIPNNGSQIESYLPLFYDLNLIDQVNLTELRPYHCKIDDRPYFFHLDCKKHQTGGEQQYELILMDVTHGYTQIQNERSAKNQLLIDQDYLIQRLDKKVKENTEVKQLNSELELILAHSKEGIVYLNCSDGKVVEANSKALELFGCKNHKELDQVQFLSDATAPNNDRDLFQYLWLNSENQNVSEELVSIIDEDSELRYFNSRIVSNVPIRSNTVSTVFISDITLEHNSAQKLQAKNLELEKYIESNVQLEQFAHVASHDLRAPIITVKSFSKLLADRSINKLDKEEKKYLSIIREHSDQMFELVNDLLTYAQVNSQKLRPKSTCTHTLVQAVYLSFKSSFEEKGIKMIIPDLLPELIIDGIKIRRVLQNLISNSIKFYDSQKASFIKITCIELSTEFQFVIEDNGIGIIENAKDIFQPYTRLNLSSMYDGTGMGLAISKNIIEDHGGAIHYESVHGDGAKFIFTINKDLKIR